MTVGELMRLPWTWHGPVQVHGNGADAYWELRVQELPEFFVAGRTSEEVLAASGPALHAFLLSYLDHGETPPLPANQTLSWLPMPAMLPTDSAIPLIPSGEPQLLIA